MQIGMIGLGRMGSNMVLRLMAGGHQCVVYDADAAARKTLSDAGATAVDSLAGLAAALQQPRVVWMMVPDTVVDSVIDELAELLQAGDILVDGGNSWFPEDQRRASQLAQRDISYMDVGTSGGVWGRERGYCLMVGGEQAAFERLEPALKTLAPARDSVPATPGQAQDGSTADQGYLHCGGHGAGHFVKMVHNGIEYGLMAAYAEGFAMLNKAASPEHRDGLEPSVAAIVLEASTAEIAELWRRGSVVGSWLLDLTAQSLKSDPALARFSHEVSDSGEGRWTVKTATDMGIPAHVLSAALFARFSSRGEADYSNRMLSAMRYAFGGHMEKTPPDGHTEK